MLRKAKFICDTTKKVHHCIHSTDLRADVEHFSKECQALIAETLTGAAAPVEATEYGYRYGTGNTTVILITQKTCKILEVNTPGDFYDKFISEKSTKLRRIE